MTKNLSQAEQSPDPMPPATTIHYYDNNRTLMMGAPAEAQMGIIQDLETSAPTGSLSIHSIFVAFSLLGAIGLPIPHSVFINKFLRAKSLEPKQIRQAVEVIKATGSQETYKEALEVARQNYPQLGL